MSQAVVTFFNPLKVPITQYVSTHVAPPAGDRDWSWICLCEQNLGLAQDVLQGETRNTKIKPLPL